MSTAPSSAGAEAGERPQDEHHYLSFSLLGELYALPILEVELISEYGTVTPVPMMPEFIRGVTNVRGRVVPVLDLAARFGKGRSAIGRRSCIIIVELEVSGERHEIGVIADAVNQVLEIPARDVEPPPTFGASIRTDFIAGLGRLGERFVIILDVARVLSVEELASLVQLGQGTAARREGA